MNRPTKAAIEKSTTRRPTVRFINCFMKSCSKNLERTPLYLCGSGIDKKGCAKYFCDIHLLYPIHLKTDASFCESCISKLDKKESK